MKVGIVVCYTKQVKRAAETAGYENMDIEENHGTAYYEANSDVTNYFFLEREKNNWCRAHYHNSVEVMFVIGGRHAVWANGVKSELEAGDLCISNSFDIHYYHYIEESDIDILLVSNDFLTSFHAVYPGKEFPNILRRKGDSYREVAELFDIMHRNKTSNRQVLFGLVNALWGVLLKYYALREIVRPNTNGIVDVLAYIEEHSAENLTIESLAEKFSYNKVYFSRMFNNSVGMHFRDYLNRVRLYKFNIMRQDDETASATKLAMDCGFDNMSTYYRVLKKEKERIENGET